MKRSKPLRRTPLRRSRNEGPTLDREPKPWAPATLKALRCGTYAGSTSGPAPKSEPHRNPALLDMARDRPCLLLIPGCCNHRLDTTVACHSNRSTHGKAGARKADDEYSVWGCSACHRWLDQGTAPAGLKEQVFAAGHARQVSAWQEVAHNQVEPAKSRRAALWALHQLTIN